MKEIRKKQKRLFTAMRAVVAVTLVYIVVYIGVQPYLPQLGTAAVMAFSYLSDILIVAALVLALVYYSRYGKVNAFLTRIEHEIKDCGFYYIAGDKTDEESFLNALFDSLAADGFAMESNVEYDGLELGFTAFKRRESLYVCGIDELSKDDVLAYLDCAVNDLTVRRLKRAGNSLLVFVTDEAQQGAVALSKMICTFGKKEQLKLGICIAEPKTGRCYFLGNMQTKLQSMAVRYVMRSTLPILDKLKSSEPLPFQAELERHMEDFTIKSYLDGTFYAH